MKKKQFLDRKYKAYLHAFFKINTTLIKPGLVPHQQLPEGDDVRGGGVVPVVVVHNDAVLTATDAKT